MKPLDVLVENGGNAQAIAAKLRDGAGRRRRGGPDGLAARHDSLVEAFPNIDGAAPGIQGIINRVNAQLKGTDGTLTGVPPPSTATSCTRSTAASRTCSRS